VFFIVSVGRILPLSHPQSTNQNNLNSTSIAHSRSSCQASLPLDLDQTDA